MFDFCRCYCPSLCPSFSLSLSLSLSPSFLSFCGLCLEVCFCFPLARESNSLQYSILFSDSRNPLDRPFATKLLEHPWVEEVYTGIPEIESMSDSSLGPSSPSPSPKLFFSPNGGSQGGSPTSPLSGNKKNHRQRKFFTLSPRMRANSP